MPSARELSALITVDAEYVEEDGGAEGGAERPGSAKGRGGAVGAPSTATRAWVGTNNGAASSVAVLPIWMAAGHGGSAISSVAVLVAGLLLLLLMLLLLLLLVLLPPTAAAVAPAASDFCSLDSLPLEGNFLEGNFLMAVTQSTMAPNHVKVRV